MAVREHGEEMVAGVRVPREIIVDLAGYGDVGPVVQCLKPGDRLMVTGEYRRRTYTTQGGEVRNVLRCTVQAVEPVSVAGAF
jgi:DNA replicative helicase MCM subunit Mcm2 (Cdc46/Mcm family)